MIVRGYIYIPAQAVGRYFMFNPNEVKDTKGITWGSKEIPGASHPVYQYGAGGERLISLNLYIDGDRGRKGRQQARAGVNTTTGEGPLSIMDELMWYRSLQYPRAYGQRVVDVGPSPMLLSFGELYQKTPVICKKADWDINYWTPNLEPVRAVVTLQLAEVVPRSQVRGDLLQAAGLLR